MSYNPFNPQQPARPDLFVGREPEILEFEKFLIQTEHGSPMNLAVTGNRGMGKTSLLKKFESLGREKNSLVLNLSNYEGNISRIEDLEEYVFSNLKNEFISRHAFSMEKVKGIMDSLSVKVEYGGASLSIEKKQIVAGLLSRKMLRVWEAIKDHHNSVVILIDEAESLEKIKALAFLREVFQRIQNDANYMVILAGKLNFPERMSESFSPLNRFFQCLKLKPFNKKEVKAHVEKKLSSVKLSIDDEVMDDIFTKSEGHPYVLTLMCYLIVDSLNGNEFRINKSVLKRAEKKINSRLGQDFFSPMHHPLTPKAKKILETICRNVKGVEFTFADVVKWTEMKRNQVSPYIQELHRKGILNKPERARYELFHGLFLEYMKASKHKSIA